MTHLEKIEVVVRELEKQRVLLAKRFDAEMKSLDERIAEQYELCPHSSRTYYPDPSGNGDSSYTCDICGFEFR
jgi:transposase-like protein